MSNTLRPSSAEPPFQEDESPLLKVFRTSPVAMTMHRWSDRKFAYVNSAFVKMSGWAHEELIGRTMLELNMVDSDVAERMGAILDREAVLLDVEGSLRSRTGGITHVLVSTELVDLHGDQYAITTFVDVTQRDRAVAIESRLSALWKTSLDALVAMDGFGIITAFNPAAEKIFGYSAEEVLGTPLADRLIPPASRDAHRNGIKRFLATGEGSILDRRIELTALRADGSEFPVELTVTAAADPTGPFFIGTLRDLTSRKQAEEGVRQSEERYRTLVDSAPDGIFINQEKRIVFANPAFLKMLGAVRADEVIGREPFEFLHPDDHNQVDAMVASLTEIGAQTPLTERKFIRFDGSTADVEVAASVVLFEGKPAIQVYVRDITERKRTEESLAVQTEMLTTVTEALDEYVQHRNWRTAMGRLLKMAITRTESEYGFIGVVVDSTLRVLAHEGIVWDDVLNRDFYEDALRRYKELGYLEFTSFDNLFGHVITTGRVIVANNPDGDPRSTGRPAGHPPMNSFLGVPIFAGEKVQGIVALANRPSGYTSLDRRTIETLVKHAGGLCTSYRHNETALAAENERVEAEARRLESLERFQTVARATNDAVWDWDLETNTVWWNEGFQTLFGYRQDEIEPGTESWINRLHSQDKEAVVSRVDDVISGQDRTWSSEYRFRKADGSYAEVFDRGYVIRNASGKAVRMIGAMQDITERKRTEHALREYTERLKLAVQASNVGLWDWDLNSGRVIYSLEWKSQLGYAEDEISDHFGEWQRRVHPDDRRAALRRLREHIDRRTGVYESEFRMRHKDGSWRWIYARGEVFTGSTGMSERMLGCHVDITASKLAELELIKSEERYRHLVENARDIIYTHDLQGNYTSVNRASEFILGYSPEESLQMNIMQTVAPEYLDVAKEMTARKLSGEETTAYELEVIGKDGRRISLEVNSKLMLEDGVPVGVQGIARDVTERKQLENQLRQSQKLEAVGRLAGGIAHDFNNLLTAILGYSEMFMSRFSDSQPGHHEIEEIHRAGHRAAELTRQLLAFSRKQVLQPKVLDLNTSVKDIQNLIARLIGEDITIDINLSDDLGRVRADPSQIEQIIMNLAVNARDAMPKGGRLTIETSNVDLDKMYAEERVAVTPGPHVMLAVSDTGSGMDKQVQAQIFEPFFTTKEKGKGTGLGLSTVYGIVKQSGGNIWVYSEPGMGTTFKIYLPRVDQDPEPARSHPMPQLPFPGTATILLIEDEESVRSLARSVLTSNGYTVLEAATGEEALNLYRENPGKFDLVLTDVVMPGIGGHETARQLVDLGFKGEFVFMSGYTENAIVGQTGENAATSFLQKPFGPDALLVKVRETLEADKS